MSFIPSTDFYTEVAKGNVPGHELLTKFGRNDNIGTATDPEDVWQVGGLYTGQPTGAPETVDIDSTSTADDGSPVGTGMRTMRILGLKTSTSVAIESEDITLDGTTTVTSASTWYRVFTAFGLTYGSGGTNAGLITINHTTTTANVFASILAGRGRTQVCVITMPDTVTGYVVGIQLTMALASNAAGDADVDLCVRDFGSGGYNIVRDYQIKNSEGINHLAKSPLILPPKSDLVVRVEEVSNNNTSVVAELEILMVTD